uniref:Uncharacterized protein n=1 Tax=Leersia perrieri TaxID=77586 RepID=A0A0D9UY46_9ORYZ
MEAIFLFLFVLGYVLSRFSPLLSFFWVQKWRGDEMRRRDPFSGCRMRLQPHSRAHNHPRRRTILGDAWWGPCRGRRWRWDGI